jgi:hypothetical protein
MVQQFRLSLSIVGIARLGFANFIQKDPSHSMKNTCLAIALGVLVVSSALAQDVSFNRDIRPILSDNCYFCHGFDENNRESDLRLDQRDEALSVIEPGQPDESELLRRILSEDEDEVMPPPSAHKKPLSEAQRELIRRWISEGAKYEEHWAFVAPVRPQVAASTTASAIDYFIEKRLKKNGLEFSNAALPTKWLRRVTLDLTGLPPTLAELDSFKKDAAARGDAAYSDAVDRLFASPHYGERMALDWLDVARYADTNGFQMDAYRMNWPWRDWVTKAFNDNMPYDQFTIEQLAGDLLDNPTQDQVIATAFNRNHMINGEGGAIVAENLAKNNFDRVETTGTAWLGLTVGCCQCHDHKFDPLKQKDYFSLYAFFNQISETGMASKKFSAKRPGKEYAENFWVDKPFVAVATEQQQARLDSLAAATKQARQKLEDGREEFWPEFVKWVEEMRADPELPPKRIEPTYVRREVNTAPLDKPKDSKTKLLLDYFLKKHDKWSAVKKSIAKVVSEEAKFQAEIPLVMVMRDDQPRETFVMLRGNYETLGDKVSAKVPEFLPKLPNVKEGETPNRLNLARWLVSDSHPLTARVTVNRYWQLAFGRGLVATPDDFGLQGELPTHPDLLDWLAVEFRESGWDVQSLLRGMVLSRTYRQSSRVDASVIAKDPKNKWHSRGTRYRLDSRLLRDQALALSGLLVKDIGGKPVSPYQPGGIWESMSLNKNHYMRDDGDDLYRRSLYTVWRRVVSPANFFDTPSRQNCSVKPSRTNTPLHALTTLNDTTYAESARVWASRLASLPDDESRLQRLFFAATARQLQPSELESLLGSLARARDHFKAEPDEAVQFIAVGEAKNGLKVPVEEHAAWTTMCLLILNLDETLCK